MNFEEYWYALEYKEPSISTNTNFLQPRPDTLRTFGLKMTSCQWLRMGDAKKVYKYSKQLLELFQISVMLPLCMQYTASGRRRRHQAATASQRFVTSDIRCHRKTYLLTYLRTTCICILCHSWFFLCVAAFIDDE